jgi:lipoprotein LprG
VLTSPLAVLLTVLALVLGLAGCGGAPSGPPPEPLPPGPELLARSADVMATLKTVALDVQVDPALAGLPIRSANGKLTATGEATGSAVIAMGGPATEFQFVVTRGTLYLKGATGGYQRFPLEVVAGIYDPTALLRPDTGVAALLRTATQGITETIEDVNGVPAYRVWANLDPQVAGKVVPGITGVVGGQVWLDKATSRLLRARVNLPTGGPDNPTAPVTINLSDFDAPVTVKPPASS